MKNFPIHLVFLLFISASPVLARYMKCSAQYESKYNSLYATFTFQLPKVTAFDFMVFFQLCFLPSFPFEIPDDFWIPGQSECYFSKDSIPKYTAIGRPIRLLNFPATAAQSLLRYGNGVLDIERISFYEERNTLKIIVRKNVLQAGKYICHIFKLQAKLNSGRTSMLPKDNEIKTLDKASGFKVVKDDKYCTIFSEVLENLSEGEDPTFEDNEYISFICDLCWFESKKPPIFKVIVKKTEHIVSYQMHPENPFRRYFGFFRVAEFPDHVRKMIIASGKAVLSLGEDYKNMHMPFNVEFAPSLPSFHIRVFREAHTLTQGHDGLQEEYFTIVKKSMAGALHVILLPTDKVHTKAIERVEIICLSTGFPIPKVIWKLSRHTDNLEISTKEENILILHDPTILMDYDTSCTSEGMLKGKKVRSKTVHLLIYNDGKMKNGPGTLANLFSFSSYNLLCFVLILSWFYVRSEIFKQLEYEMERDLRSDVISSAEELDDRYF